VVGAFLLFTPYHVPPSVVSHYGIAGSSSPSFEVRRVPTVFRSFPALFYILLHDVPPIFLFYIVLTLRFVVFQFPPPPYCRRTCCLVFHPRWICVANFRFPFRVPFGESLTHLTDYPGLSSIIYRTVSGLGFLFLFSFPAPSSCISAVRLRLRPFLGRVPIFPKHSDFALFELTCFSLVMDVGSSPFPKSRDPIQCFFRRFSRFLLLTSFP